MESDPADDVSDLGCDASGGVRLDEEQRSVQGDALIFLEPRGPTPIAKRVKRLCAAVNSVIEKRERLPQPLFWSLFRLEVREVRRARARKRMLQKILYDPE